MQSKTEAGTTKKEPSEAYKRALAMLPPDQHEALGRLVEQYKFAAMKHHGSPMCSPRVIAELILMGWTEGDSIQPPAA